ncbi:hypothetical protein FRC08_008143, partial [Ceratobasidium sp. 394]
MSQPSRKHRSTPPKPSPAKRHLAGLPDPAAELTAPLPPPVDPATWSERVITATTNTIGASHHGSNDELLIAHMQVRAHLLACINGLDEAATREGLDVPLSCPESCPGLATPKPAVPVAHKAVATDPPPPENPVVEAMDLDHPPVATAAADPAPRTYASVAVGTPATPASKPPVSAPKPSPKPHTPAKVPAPAAPAPKPIRLIVRPPADSPRLGSPFAQVLLRGPSEPFRLLSHAMSLSPQTKDVTLLGVHQNRSKNLVVSLPAGTPDATVDAVVQVVRKTLLSFGSAP